MTENPSPGARPGGRPAGAGAGAVVVFVVASVVGIGAWWALRAGHARSVTERLAPWAEAPLPRPGDPIDTTLAALGADVFQTHCAGCHALQGESRIGPNLEGVTGRRSFAWMRSMILHPDSMTRDDPAAQALLETSGIQMKVPGSPLEPVHARALIEFFRRLDGASGG